MTIPVLEYILSLIITSVSQIWLFIPVIVMGVFALTVRLFLRRYF